MNRNACGLDRIARLVVGPTIVLLALRRPPGAVDRETDIAIWQVLAVYAGMEILATGLMGWCPANALLGINTCTQDWRTAVRSVVGSARGRIQGAAGASDGNPRIW